MKSKTIIESRPLSRRTLARHVAFHHMPTIFLSAFGLKGIACVSELEAPFFPISLSDLSDTHSGLARVCSDAAERARGVSKCVLPSRKVYLGAAGIVEKDGRYYRSEGWPDEIARLMGLLSGGECTVYLAFAAFSSNARMSTEAYEYSAHIPTISDAVIGKVAAKEGRQDIFDRLSILRRASEAPREIDPSGISFTSRCQFFLARQVCMVGGC